MTYGYQEAKELAQMELRLQHELVQCGSDTVLNIPLIMGPVGAGKTAIARELVLEWDLPLCPINSGENSDATDLSGIPLPADALRGDGQRYMEWVLNKYAYMAVTQPVFLFFDDLDKAPPPVQSAMLAITANRMFRDKPLHPGTLLMGAGNRIDDDMYAHEISESMRTRMTTIDMVPDLKSFSEYAKSSAPNKNAEHQAIHPKVIGYLQYAPDHLHQWKDGVNRFATPRGWWEASRHMYAYPHKHWKGIVSRKCGDHIANDFWAWDKILSQINVDDILTKGTTAYGGNDKRMAQYAAIFAVAERLTRGVKKTYSGIVPFVKGLKSEMRIAFAVQLSTSTRSKIANMFPEAATALMSEIVKTADNGKVALRPAVAT